MGFLSKVTGVDNLVNLHKTMSRMQFAKASNAPVDGFQGATINPYTYEVAQVGKTPIHLVGGATNAATGERIPTTFVDQGRNKPQLMPWDVEGHLENVRQASGNNPKTFLGSWVDQKAKRQGVQIDASTALPANTPAEKIQSMLEDRGEKESFNVKDPSQSVKNPKFKYNKGKK